jgi:hypothetical protein
MPELDDFGIVSIDTALTRRFKLRAMVEVPEPVLDEVGEFHQNAAYGKDFVFEAEGSGDLPADFAIGGNGTDIDGLSGGVTVVLRGGEKQTLGRHNDWSASGEHAPNAA